MPFLLDDGVVTKPPSVALLCVNSDDQQQFDRETGLRFSSTNPSRIFINNQQPFLVGYMTRLALTEVAMEYDTPNVNSYNNTLTIGFFNNASVRQGVVRLVFETAFYTAIDLGIAVANALNSNPELITFFGPNTFTVEFGGVNMGGEPSFAGRTITLQSHRYTIETSSANGRFAILPCTVGYPGLSPIQDDLTAMMGLTPSQNAVTSSYKSVLGGFASLQYTPFLDIISTLLTKNQNIRDGTSQKANINTAILARVYLANEAFTPRVVTVTFGDDEAGTILSATDNAIGCTSGTLRREFSMPKQIKWNNTENVDIIDIQVLDSRGRPLFYNPSIANLDADTVQISNTADLFFTIQASES